MKASSSGPDPAGVKRKAARSGRKPPVPRWETPEPTAVAGSYGPAVISWAKRELKIELGGWQGYAINQMLRHDRNGDLFARVALLGTGRQNGKSIIVRSIVGWMLDEGRKLPAFGGWTTILAAAHDAKQARIVYRGVAADYERNPRLKSATRITQYFGIEAGGLLFDTVTSQPGSARGLSAGLIAWDEMLTQEDWDMWEALSPTQSAQRNPLMILTSTAGHPGSIVLRSFYDRLVRQASGDEKPDPRFYGAWWQSPSPDTGLDWAAIEAANPALRDGRLTRDAIKLEHSILPVASWQRERLNHWAEVKAEGAFHPGVWAALRTPEPLEGVAGPFHLGVDIEPGWKRATIVVAAVRPDGRYGAEVYRDLRAEDGNPITADRLIHELEAFPQPVSTISFDSVSGAAGAFGRHAETAYGAEWIALKPNLVVAACMDLTEMIQSGKLAADDPLLDAQVQVTVRRAVGQDGAFRFSRANSLGPVDAMFALTFAVNGAARQAPAPAIL